MDEKFKHSYTFFLTRIISFIFCAGGGSSAAFNLQCQTIALCLCYYILFVQILVEICQPQFFCQRLLLLFCCQRFLSSHIAHLLDLKQNSIAGKTEIIFTSILCLSRTQILHPTTPITRKFIKNSKNGASLRCFYSFIYYTFQGNLSGCSSAKCGFHEHKSSFKKFEIYLASTGYAYQLAVVGGEHLPTIPPPSCPWQELCITAQTSAM